MIHYCVVDRSVTEKQFKFASQYGLPFEYVSAADGTNVVKIFKEAMKLGLAYKLNPKDKFMSEVMDLLKDVKPCCIMLLTMMSRRPYLKTTNKLEIGGTL